MLDLMRYEPWRLSTTPSVMRDWFFGPSFWERFSEGDKCFACTPNMDMSEGENEYRLTAEVPGMTKEDVTVHIENGQLRVQGEFKSEHRDDEGHYHLRERRYGSFSRTMCIPNDVDESGIEASVKDGVLTVTLPKSEGSKPKQIEIH